MKIEIPKPSELHLTEEQAKRLLKILFGDDLDYYEECIMHLPDDEQKRFFEKNPDFMSEFAVTHDMMYLLKDKMFRGILRKIKNYDGGM